MGIGGKGARRLSLQAKGLTQEGAEKVLDRQLPERAVDRLQVLNDIPGAGARAHMPGETASSLGALAYTRGSELNFAPGRYDPGRGGSELLGHELAHVVQQGQGRIPRP